MAINAEGRKALLSMTGQYGSQINGTRTLRSVEAPHSFRIIRIHVHRLGTIAPAGSDGNGRAYAFAFEFFSTSGTFGHTTDGTVGNHTLYGAAVAIFQVTADQLGHSFCQAHGLFFQTLANTALTTVDGRADTNFRILFHKLFYLILTISSIFIHPFSYTELY